MGSMWFVILIAVLGGLGQVIAKIAEERKKREQERLRQAREEAQRQQHTRAELEGHSPVPVTMEPGDQMVVTPRDSLEERRQAQLEELRRRRAARPGGTGGVSQPSVSRGTATTAGSGAPGVRIPGTPVDHRPQSQPMPQRSTFARKPTEKAPGWQKRMGRTERDLELKRMQIERDRQEALEEEAQRIRRKRMLEMKAREEEEKRRRAAGITPRGGTALTPQGAIGSHAIGTSTEAVTAARAMDASGAGLSRSVLFGAMRDRESLRRAFVLKEILEAPVALRHESGGDAFI